MKKMMAIGLAAVTAASLLAGCGGSGSAAKTESGAAETSAETAVAEQAEGGEASKELNIYMWSDDISESLVSEFEKENDCKVNFTYMSDNADAINQLTAGAGDKYDLVMTCDAYMESLIKGGYLEKLDLSKIPNAEKNMNKTYWREDIRDYCMPYLMNYIYVVYNKDTCPIEIKGYNDLLDPQLKGQIGSVDGARNLFPIALVALGYDPNSTDENEIKEAYEWLQKYNENVAAYGSTEQNLVNGTISVMLAYDGNTKWAMDQMGDKNSLVIAPFEKDPVQLGMDLYVIPKGAKHQDLAYKFLDYIADADVMAKNLDEYPYSCPNDAAVAAASDDYKNSPAFNFDYKDNIFFQEDVGDALTIYDKYYQMLKVNAQ